MKKILFVLTFVLAIVFPYLNSGTPVKAEEGNIVLLTNSNFVSEITNPENTDFKLTENITLETWAPIDFSGNLDGNGFKITLDKNLFQTLENANISNLGITFSDTYVFDNTGYSHQNSDFGALAQNAVFSSINKVYAVANIQVKSKSSLSVGGLIGKIEGTTIKNSYVKTEIAVKQFSGEALSTVVGGFVGNSYNSLITNCYAVPISTSIINAEVDESLVNPKTELLVGGFVGLAEKGIVGVISNNFCGGNIVTKYLQSNAQISTGKIFGEVKGFSDNKLSFCHTFNSQSEMAYLGEANSYENIRLTQKDSVFFSESDNFLQTTTDSEGDVWNFLYSWNTDTIWTKKETSQFLVLQIFENFTVTLETRSNDESLECGIFIFDGEDFASTDLISFKFGDRLLINTEVKEDFLHYKQIKSLLKTISTNEVDLVFNENKSSASYEFTVNAETSGSYYATASNIEYTLIIRTADSNMGYVKDISNVNQTEITRKIMQDGEDRTFVADPRSNSYVFTNWTWIGGQGESSIAVRGPVPATPEEEKWASKQITIGFGKTGTNSQMTYVNFDSVPAIPYTVADDGSITFTLEANFTQNVCNLNIQSTLDADACSIYIDGILQDENIVDYINLFNDSVQIGVSIEIKIVMKENYIFKKWKSGGIKPLSEFISSDETENSQTINLKISSDFLLILEIEAEEQTSQDLMWLWIVLGGVGGLGLIALVIVLIVRSSKKKDFLNYY